jgi:hypothetical protein
VRGHGCMVVGVAVMCARQLLGCQLVALETFCPWWPSFPASPLLGAHSLRHETNSRNGAAVALAPAPNTSSVAAALGG